MSNYDDFDNELEESIAQIVDEETSGAEKFVEDHRYDSKDYEEYEDENSEDEDNAEEDDSEEEKSGKPNMVLIIILIIVGVLIVGGVGVTCFMLYKNAVSQTEQSFDYYKSNGYTVYKAAYEADVAGNTTEAKDEYTKAAEFFESAISCEEGKKDTVLMMQLYHCYHYLGNEDKAVAMLDQVLIIDAYNVEAVADRLVIYATNKDYDAIHNLYEKYKDCGIDEIVNRFDSYIEVAPTAKTDLEPESDGNFSDDVEVTLRGSFTDTVIYYTLDGTDPTVNSSIYSEPILFEEGKATLKYFSTNQFGFASEICTMDIKVVYNQPSTDCLKFSPDETEFRTADSQLLTILKIPFGFSVYYTLDGTDPTTDSSLYRSRITLPAGECELKLILVNKHGVASEVLSRKYTVVKEENFSKADDDECINAIYKELRDLGIINKKNKDANKKEYVVEYYTSTKIGDDSFLICSLSIGGEMQSYYLACNRANTGKVYAVTKAGGEYTKHPVSEFVIVEDSTPEETTGEDTSKETEETVEKVKIPEDIIGMKKTDAVALLEDLGLTVVIQKEYSSEVKKNRVISIDGAKPGKKVAKGSEIILIISRGSEEDASEE